MKTKILKWIAILILILSTLFFLQSISGLLIAGFLREHHAIEINDDNRKTLVSLLEENISCYEEIPAIEQATRVEYLALMHKDKITFHYNDETTHTFFIHNAATNPFTLYIKNEGYNVYFKSSEFTSDFKKATIPFIIFLISLVPAIILLCLAHSKRQKYDILNKKEEYRHEY